MIWMPSWRRSGGWWERCKLGSFRSMHKQSSGRGKIKYNKIRKTIYIRFTVLVWERILYIGLDQDGIVIGNWCIGFVLWYYSVAIKIWNYILGIGQNYFFFLWDIAAIWMWIAGYDQLLKGQLYWVELNLWMVCVCDNRMNWIGLDWIELSGIECIDCDGLSLI